MEDFIKLYFNKGYAVARCDKCDGMEVPFSSDDERATWVTGHREGHEAAAQFGF